MNLDKALIAIESGFKEPDTVMRRVAVPAVDLAQHGLRRKGQDETQWLWMITVGERGQAPTWWAIDHTLNKVFRKALTWRGVPPKKKGVRKNGAPAQPQATG